MESIHGVINIKDWVVNVKWANGIESNSEFLNEREADNYKKYIETEYPKEAVEVKVFKKK